MSAMRGQAAKQFRNALANLPAEQREAFILKPVALTATVLLAFSLVMNIVIESPSRYEQVVTEPTESVSRLDSDFAAKESRAMTEEKRTQFDLPVTGSPSTPLPSTMVAEDRESTIKEITVMARKAELLADVEAESLTRFVMFNMNSDAALLVIAEYVAVAETGTGRAESARQEPTSPAVAGRIRASGNERRPDGESDADGPEALLHAIDRSHTSGESAEAVARLEEFLARFPDHPVSIRIRQQDNRP